MKLPFEFNTRLIFRLVLPGAILAAAALPFIQAVLRGAGIWIKAEFVYPAAIVLCGWLIVACDMRIYMAFEGRRYWPRRLRTWAVDRERQRLQRLAGILDAPNVDRRRFLEAGVEYSHYPLDEKGEAYVAHPTRVGNLIEAFETYPKIKYGLDSVFFWYRLWVVLDKDLREEIAGAQSVADSTIYVSFALYVSGLLMWIYSACRALAEAPWLARYVQANPPLPYLPSAETLLVLGLVCLLAGFLIYRVSLTAHAQFGELFKAVFDQFRSRLSFEDIVKEAGRIGDQPGAVLRSQREKNRIVWRYLRWHMVRDEAAGKNLTVKQWEERLAARGEAAGKEG